MTSFVDLACIGLAALSALVCAVVLGRLYLARFGVGVPDGSKPPPASFLAASGVVPLQGALLLAPVWLRVIVPPFHDAFARFGGELPAVTRMLLRASDLFVALGGSVLLLQLFLGAGVAALGAWLVKRGEATGALVALVCGLLGFVLVLTAMVGIYWPLFELAGNVG